MYVKNYREKENELQKTKIVFFNLSSDVMQFSRLCTLFLFNDFQSTVIETERLFPEVSFFIGGCRQTID